MSEMITYFVDGVKKYIFLENVIDTGSSGVVYKGLLEGFGYVAVKIQKATRENYKLIGKEVRVRQILGSMPDYAIPIERVLYHPIAFKNIPRGWEDVLSLTDSISQTQAICIYPYAGDLDLFRVVEIRHLDQSLPEGEKYFSKGILVQYIKNLLKGLYELHKHNIAHLDIKPENIVLDKGQLKYIDFAFSCFYPHCADRLGSPQYMAPEILISEKIQNWEKPDVFSLGVVIFFLMTLGHNLIKIKEHKNEQKEISEFFAQHPNLDEVNQIFLQRIHEFDSIFVQFDYVPILPLLEAMVDPDETQRPTAEECFLWAEQNL